jgi:hypothetical protein
MATTTLRAPKPATEKQVRLLCSLVKQVELTIEQHAQMRAQADAGMTTKQASSWIGLMFQMRDDARASSRFERMAA